MSRTRQAATLIIVITLSLFTTACSQTARTQNPADTITVMTYNIHHGEGTDRKLDLDRIAQIISTENVDIVGLQEVDNNYSARSNNLDQAKILAEKLQMHYVYGPAIVSGDPAKPNLYGNAILSRFPITDSITHKLTTQTNHEPRVCIEAKIAINNKDYTFMVTHLDHRSTELRTAQTKDILNAAEKINTPIILMGDFNCQPPGPNPDEQWAKKTKPVALILRKFEDSFLPKDQDNPSTSVNKRRIDYIFVSPNLKNKVSSAKVVNTPQAQVASDHKPLLTHLKK
jgi:endonuclease/exonuclease/phosphatase family metal-dependent hydrolase